MPLILAYKSHHVTLILQLVYHVRVYYGGGTLDSARNVGNSQLFQQPHTNHQHQMIKITNPESIENHLFSKPRIRLLLICALGGWGTQSNITHFV